MNDVKKEILLRTKCRHCKHFSIAFQIHDGPYWCVCKFVPRLNVMLGIEQCKGRHYEKK